MQRFFRRLFRIVPLPALIFFLLGIAAGVIHILAIQSTAFADAFNGTVSAALRIGLAKATGWIPFSLAEFFALGSPVIVVAVIVLATRRASRSRRYLARVLIGMLSFLCLLYALFVFTFGVGYRTTELAERIGLDRRKVTASELADTTRIVVGELNALADDVAFVRNTGSVRPYGHDETVALCLESYDKLSDRYPFLARLDAPVKQLVVSDLMTYTHISGVYTFFTGEANLNYNYPNFVNVSTTAHEMAHQRGIAREDEANFIAFLVCTGSDDPYMRYAGYLNLYEYLSDALRRADPAAREEIAAQLDLRVRYDLYCYSLFFDRYRENTAAKVSSTVNNTYLVMQGTEGERSYGLVVDLAVAYYRDNVQ